MTNMINDDLYYEAIDELLEDVVEFCNMRH